MATKRNISDNPLSAAWNGMKDVLPGSLGAIVLGSALAYGTGRLMWSPGVEVARSLFRYPGRKLSGMTNEQWDQRMDELREDEEYKTKIPAYMAGITGLGVAALAFNNGEDWNGIGTTWDVSPRPTSYSTTTPFVAGMHKKNSLQKQSDLMDSNSFMSGIDLNQSMNANTTKQLFANDPFLIQNDPYARNLSTSIIQNAAMNAGTSNITMGNVFDSAMDKFTDKLSFSGVAKAGTRALVANCMSQLFTGALDTMIGLSPSAQQNIIDAGTWAGAISAIVS